MSTFGSPGLQCEGRDGKIIAVKPEKNHLLVNLGRCLARILGEEFRATRHRVVDTGEERFSQP